MSFRTSELIVEESIQAPSASDTVSGLMSSTDKAKLNAVAEGATANATDAALRDRATHTGTQEASTISDFNTAADSRVSLHANLTNNPHGTTKAQVGLGNADNTSDLDKPVSTAQQAALDLKYNASNPSGFETPSELNTRDTNNRARSNHTGTQLSSTISDFADTVRSTVLTGFAVGADAVLLAADTVLLAFGKVQAQLTAIRNLLNAHASRHLPSGGDPLTTASAITIGTTSANDEGNADSFARSNHSHKVEIGRANVRAVNQVQTTSATDVLLTDMTITPPAGTYLVFAYASTNNSSNNAINTFGIYAGGVPQADTSGGIQVQSNRRFSWNASCEVNVTGSDAIEIRWSRNTGTARCFGRYITIIRVA